MGIVFVRGGGLRGVLLLVGFVRVQWEEGLAYGDGFPLSVHSLNICHGFKIRQMEMTTNLRGFSKNNKKANCAV